MSRFYGLLCISDLIVDMKYCTYAAGDWQNIVTIIIIIIIITSSSIIINHRRLRNCRQVLRRWAPSVVHRSVRRSSLIRRASNGSVFRPPCFSWPLSFRCRRRRVRELWALSRRTFRRGAAVLSPATETVCSGRWAGGSPALKNSIWRSE